MRGGVGVPKAPPDGVLFQEWLASEPFWMLVACSLVNLTTWEQAKPAFAWLRRSYAGEHELACAHEESLHGPLRPLGLWRRRSALLVRMADAYLARPPATSADVLRLPGCGRYAADSWALFVERRYDVHPKDGKLLWHIARGAGNAGHIRARPSVQ